MIMACAALALLMTPALGLFYGGMVRRKNVLSAFQQAFILLGVVPIQWFLVGYSLSFGPDVAAGCLGGWQWFGLLGVGLEPNVELAPRLPHQLFMTFEMMVAVFTAALISGAIAERMKFASYVVFVLLWTTLVFDPVAHWVWSPGGWIRRIGALDFAGGLVVHLTSGLAALCSVWLLGKRKGLDTEDLHPHNLTLTALGTGLLWFCWLGLNAGQARGSRRAAAAAVVATILAGSAAIVSWSALEYFQKRKVTVLGACTGAIAGLGGGDPGGRLCHSDRGLWSSGSWYARSFTERSWSRASSATTTRSTSLESMASAPSWACWLSACWRRPASQAARAVSWTATPIYSSPRPSRWLPSRFTPS